MCYNLLFLLFLFSFPSLREKCPNTEFFQPEYEPDKTQYLVTFHAVPCCNILNETGTIRLKELRKVIRQLTTGTHTHTYTHAHMPAQTCTYLIWLTFSARSNFDFYWLFSTTFMRSPFSNSTDSLLALSNHRN